MHDEQPSTIQMLFSFSKEVTFTETVLSDSLMEFKSSIALSHLRSSLRTYQTALAVVILLLFATTASPWASPGTKHVLVGITVAVTGAFTMWCRAQVVDESVLLVRDLGAQVRVRFWAGGESTAFMPKDMVEGVFIHEYIAGSRVRFSLAFILKGGDRKLHLLFKHIYPGFESLRRAYSACQSALAVK